MKKSANKKKINWALPNQTVTHDIFMLLKKQKMGLSILFKNQCSILSNGWNRQKGKDFKALTYRSFKGNHFQDEYFQNQGNS